MQEGLREAKDSALAVPASRPKRMIPFKHAQAYDAPAPLLHRDLGTCNPAFSSPEGTMPVGILNNDRSWVM